MKSNFILDQVMIYQILSDIIENSFSQDFCLDGELMAGSIKIQEVLMTFSKTK